MRFCKKLSGFVVIAMIALVSAFSPAQACSPAKLAILKNRCSLATGMQKATYCAQAASPHSLPFQEERNYNVTKAAHEKAVPVKKAAVKASAKKAVAKKTAVTK
jgi:hypothetical protein